MLRIDARLPVRFGALTTRRPGEAVLLDSELACAPPCARFDAAAAHPLGCACCVGLSAAGGALAALFRARAVATGPAFSGVLAVVGAGGQAAVRAAMVEDPLVSTRYRLAD